MRILLTNDDGITAEGITIMADYLEREGHDLIVVAPDVERSASSHSITITKSLTINKIKRNYYAVNGTPVDCVILALRSIIKKKCDVVISGINNGPNLAEDILYSGTVAAAIEATQYGLPAIAVSLNSRETTHFDTAAQFVIDLLNKDIHTSIPPDETLNINVPSLPYDKVKGVKITVAGNRLYDGFVAEETDPNGNTEYWLKGEKPQWKKEEDSDIEAVVQGYISITPVSPRFTNFHSIDPLRQWFLEQFAKE